MLKKPLIDRLNRGKKTEIFHSSAYGRAQNGGSLGTASTESFAQRMQMEQSRKTIQRYDASEVAARRFNPEAKGANKVGQASATGVEKNDRQNGARPGINGTQRVSEVRLEANRVRTERSEAQTGVSETRGGVNGARAGAKPQSVAPMRQVPKISWRPPRGF